MLTPLEVRGRARQILQEYLDLQGSRHQLLAAEVLARCEGSKAAWTVLHEAAEDTLWTRRQKAAAALVRLGHEAGKKVLIEDLASHRSAVRWGAAYALTRLGAQVGAESLKKLLYKRRYRLTAAEALMTTDDPDAKKLLVRMVESNDRSPSERLRAAAALALAGDRRGKRLLQEALRGESVHLDAAVALSQWGDERAVRALTDALEHTALRVKAAAVLKRMGREVDLTKLVTQMETPSEPGRVSAASAVMILTHSAQAEAH